MPRVFVSYSQDSPAHAARVLELAQQLREDGVDTKLDQFETAPDQGWARWMADELAASDFVLVVVSDGYRKKTEDRVPRGTGHGVKWESHLSVQEIYEAGARNTKFIPILHEDISEDAIPKIMRAWTWYRLPGGYDDLLRRLFDKPKVVPAPLGKPKKF